MSSIAEKSLCSKNVSIFEVRHFKKRAREKSAAHMHHLPWYPQFCLCLQNDSTFVMLLTVIKSLNVTLYPRHAFSRALLHRKNLDFITSLTRPCRIVHNLRDCFKPPKMLCELSKNFRKLTEYYYYFEVLIFSQLKCTAHL